MSAAVDDPGRSLHCRHSSATVSRNQAHPMSHALLRIPNLLELIAPSLTLGSAGTRRAWSPSEEPCAAVHRSSATNFRHRQEPSVLAEPFLTTLVSAPHLSPSSSPLISYDLVVSVVYLRRLAMDVGELVA